LFKTIRETSHLFSFSLFLLEGQCIVKRGLDGNEVGFTKTRIVTMVSAIHNP